MENSQDGEEIEWTIIIVKTDCSRHARDYKRLGAWLLVEVGGRG